MTLKAGLGLASGLKRSFRKAARLAFSAARKPPSMLEGKCEDLIHLSP